MTIITIGGSQSSSGGPLKVNNLNYNPNKLNQRAAVADHSRNQFQKMFDIIKTIISFQGSMIAFEMTYCNQSCHYQVSFLLKNHGNLKYKETVIGNNRASTK
jgi:hypothetical protein